MKRTIFSWGINDSKYPVFIAGKHIPAYTAWRDMLRRCHDPKYQANQPTYIGCYVDPVWRGFSAFQLWHMENYREGFHLDKDILVTGNKVYSPATCVYVPQHINSLLTARDAARGEFPLGVCWHKRLHKFQAMLNVSGKLKSLGYFDTPMEAFEAYKVAKKAEIKRLALEAFLNNEIKSDVYLALIRYDIKPFSRSYCETDRF